MHIILFSTDAKSQSNVENTILPGKSFKIRTLGKKTARALGSASRCKWAVNIPFLEKKILRYPHPHHDGHCTAHRPGALWSSAHCRAQHVNFKLLYQDHCFRKVQ